MVADVGAVASVGSPGSPTIACSKGPWKSSDDLEITVAEYMDWFNHRRLHGGIGMFPPVGAEQFYYDSHYPAGTTERVVESLY